MITGKFSTDRISQLGTSTPLGRSFRYTRRRHGRTRSIPVGPAIAVLLMMTLVTLGRSLERDDHGMPGAPWHWRSASPSDVGWTPEIELNSLLSAERDISVLYYRGTFPLLPIEWTDNSTDTMTYAYTDGMSIHFVRSRYEGDWRANIVALKHEVAHAAVGTEHEHDATWKREFDRLLAKPNVISLDQVRAGGRQ